MQKGRCHHVSLASSAVGKIEYCPSCQIMSLHLGAVTLRLEPAASADLRQLIGEALLALRQDLGAELAPVDRRDLS